MCGMKQEVKKVLSALKADQNLHDTHHFDSREKAMEAALQGIKEIKAGDTQTKNQSV